MGLIIIIGITLSILMLVLIINLICCIFRIANATEETATLLKEILKNLKKTEN